MSASLDAEPLEIRIPVPLGVRTLFVSAGLFVVTIATWELHRGVWPLNPASPFFLFLIFGAFSVGVPIAFAGLFGEAAVWSVEPGRLTIVRTNPFRTRSEAIAATEIHTIEVREKENSEGPNSWDVELVTHTGRRYATYDLQSRAAAERLRDQIVTKLAL